MVKQQVFPVVEEQVTTVEVVVDLSPLQTVVVEVVHLITVTHKLHQVQLKQAQIIQDQEKVVE